MQQFGSSGGTAMYEEASCFARSGIEPGTFSVDDSTSASCAAFLGLDDCLDRHLKSSGLPPLNELNPNGPDSLSGRTGDPLQHQLDFELEDNGQLLHDMLQQQQQQQEQAQQHPHPQHAEQPEQSAVVVPSPTQQQSAAAASWEESVHVLQEMLLLQQHQALQCPPLMINDHPSPSFPASSLVFANTTMPSISNTSIHCNGSGAKFPGESELLSLLQLPRCASSSMPSSIDARSKLPMTFNPPHNIATDPSAIYHNASIDYDSQIFLHQQNPPNSSLPAYNQVSLKHLFHAPQAGSQLSINASTSSTNNLIHHHLNVNVGEDKEPTTTAFTIDGRQFASPIFDFKRVEHAAKAGEPRGINHFATERQRREYLNEKYQTLRSLVPNPTKADRASIVQDAIEYVKELKRMVQELQVMVQERNRAAQLQQHHVAHGHHKKRKALHSSEESCCLQGGTGSCANLAADVENTSTQGRSGEGSCLGLLRSSLLQRTSQFGTHVDVRIVEEEVNIKLTGKRRLAVSVINEDANLQQPSLPRGSPFLLDIVVALHDLHLDLLSANGATIGDQHVFMLNTKIMEGSSTYASQVATKIIEAVDRQGCNSFAPSY